MFSQRRAGRAHNSEDGRAEDEVESVIAGVSRAEKDCANQRSATSVHGDKRKSSAMPERSQDGCYVLARRRRN
jgi:hypothetical protein